MVGSGSATTADYIHQIIVEILSDLQAHLFGRFVVMTKCIGQTGVRVGRNAEFRILGQRFHIRLELPGSKGAVKAHRKEVDVRHRVQKGFGGLTSQRSATLIGNGS